MSSEKRKALSELTVISEIPTLNIYGHTYVHEGG